MSLIDAKNFNEVIAFAKQIKKLLVVTKRRKWSYFNKWR